MPQTDAAQFSHAVCCLHAILEMMESVHLVESDGQVHSLGLLCAHYNGDTWEIWLVARDFLPVLTMAKSCVCRLSDLGASSRKLCTW